jgi:hypothetical protein
VTRLTNGLRKGSVRKVVNTADAGAGDTCSITGSATFTLRTLSRRFGQWVVGPAVAGFSAIAVTGQDAGSAQTRSAWYLLDTSGLSSGQWYSAVVKMSVLGSDGLTEVLEDGLEFYLKPAGAP